MNRLAAWLLLSALVASVVSAEETSVPVETDEGDEAGTTERVEVRSSAPPEADVAAFATSVETAEARRRGEDLADLLRRVPGARINDYGGLGSYATMSLRASTSEQVTVLVDGVPQNRALGGAVDLSSIPTTLVERVTVYRGFAPAAYGLGGMGGVVDIRTRTPDPGVHSSVDLLVGELGTGRLAGEVGLGTGAGNLSVGLEWLGSRGDFLFRDTGETLFNPEDDIVRTRENNAVRQGSLLVRHAGTAVGGGVLDVALRVQDRERGLPGIGTVRSDTARAADSAQNLDAVWSRAYGRSVELLELRADLFRQELALSDPQGRIGLAGPQRSTDIVGAGAAALIRARFGPHRTLFRVDGRRERAAVEDDAVLTQDSAGADRELLGITAEEMWTAGRLTLAPSLRWQQVRDRTVGDAAGLADPPPGIDDAAWSGKIGLAWALGPTSSVRGSFGRFYRVPSLVELYGDRGAIVGNPNLAPESGLSAELGYSGRSERGPMPWSVELVGFARRSENLIRFVPVSQGTAVARNLGEVESHGVEASLGFRPLRGLDVDATATVQRAEDLSWGAGRRLTYLPELLGYLGLSYGRGRLRARWDATYVGSNSTDTLDTPELRLPARVIHDANVAWDAGRGFVLGIDLRNVFDRQTRDLMRYPLPGRVWLVHLGWRSGAR